MTSTQHRSASDALLALVRSFPGERMTIQDIMNGLGERSFGFALLLFGLLSAIALIPGLATITSIPLLIFGLQMFVGHRTPWLPAFIAKREIGRRDLEKTLERGEPIMKWIERYCRPRLTFLVGRFGERLLGVLVFVLALVIALPGPGTNFPPGMAITFMSIAIIERDGLLLFGGILASIIALYIGWLGLHLVIAHILPGIWEFLVSTWEMIAGH